MTLSSRFVTTVKREPPPKEVGVIIPAAGASRRMRSYGNRSLIRLTKSGSNVLDRQIGIVRTITENPDIVIVTGYENEKFIKKYSQYKIVENERFEENSVVRSICLGLRVTKLPYVLIIFGDLVFSKHYLNGLIGSTSKILLDSEDRFHKDNVGMTIDGGIVQHMDYGLPSKWSQILFLTGRELELFRQITEDANFASKLCSEVVNEVIARGGIFQARVSTEEIVEIDFSKDIEKAEQISNVYPL